MPTKREFEEGLFTCTVWPGGGYEASMKPEATPYMLSAIQNMLRNAATNTMPGEIRDGLEALLIQARTLDALRERMLAEQAAPLTPAEEETLARFRAAIVEEAATAKRDNWAKESLLSAVVIAARHFAQGESVVVRRSILEVAAEVTGVPMETLAIDRGRFSVKAWRPARGEVGWLPYDVKPEDWGDGQGPRWAHVGTTGVAQ